MSLRSKESLEKFFAETRERVAKRKIAEAKQRKNAKEFRKKRMAIEERHEKKWTKRFLNAIKDDSEWREHWNEMDICTHSIEIISILSNKNELNSNEQSVLEFAFNLTYPNGV